MKTCLICLSFLLSLTSLTLTTEEEEERQINLGQLGPDLLSLLTAALAGAGTAGLVSALSGGGKGKGKDGLFGKHGLFGKDGLFGKGKGKGKKRSLLTAAERQADLSTLLALLGGNEGLSSLLLGGDGSISSLIQLPGGNGGLTSLIGNSGADAPVGKGKAGKGKDGKGGKGKDGKGKGGKGKGGKGKGTDSLSSSLLDTLSSTQEISITDIFGRKLANRGILDTLSGLTGVATDGKGGKGKDGKGKGKDGKGKGKDGKGKDGKGKGKESKGKGKDSTDSIGSSLLDTLSSALSNFGILGQIIQAVLNLLMGAGRSLNPLQSVLDTKSTAAPLPNPLTDPMGFIQNPLISAIIQAIVAGDISALMKAQGDLAGTLITQFVINAISG